MTFHIGQKVICVRPLINKQWRGTHGAVVGRIYTIRYIGPPSKNPEYGCSLLFHELQNPIHRSGVEYGFYSCRFRPLTDQSVFDKFTTGAPKDSERWDNRHKVTKHDRHKIKERV